MLITKLLSTGPTTDRASVDAPLCNFIPPLLLCGRPHFRPPAIKTLEREIFVRRGWTPRVVGRLLGQISHYPVGPLCLAFVTWNFATAFCHVASLPKIRGNLPAISDWIPAKLHLL